MFEWYEVLTLIIALGSLVLGKRRYDLIKLQGINQAAKEEAEKANQEKEKLEERLKDIEQRLFHLDDPNTGRVHKVSELCIQQIESNKQAYAMAKSALIMVKLLIQRLK